MKRINRKDFEDFIVHLGTSCAICFDNNGNILLVENIRTHGTSLEIPGGRIEFNETPLQALKREVLEETGYEIKNIKFMFKSTSSIGITDEVVHFYKCIIDKKIHNGELKSIFVSEKELKRKIILNQIMDFKTIISFLWCYVK